MATLESYREAEIDQGRILGSQYANKKDVQGGICAALCNAWILMLAAGTDHDDMDALKAEFDISISKQRIWTDAFATSGAAMDRTARYNAISYITRLEFDFQATGRFVDPLVTTLKTLKDGVFMLEIIFAKGAHMLAFGQIGDSIGLFDPNLGVFAAEGDAEVADFSAQLFAQYTTWGMPIGAWNIWKVTKAESARARMVKALAALG